MASMQPRIRNQFSTDLITAQRAVRAGVVETRARASDRSWGLWVDFCRAHSVDTWFAAHDDAIPYLQVFAARYRDGRLAPGGHPVRSDTIKNVLRDIGQTYRSMGAADIRLDRHGRTDFNLYRQLRSYTKEDPPAKRVKPLPVAVIRTLAHSMYATRGVHVRQKFLAAADMTCIGFFFLCRPGEHCTTTDNDPFCFRDVRLYIGNNSLNLRTTPDNVLRAATRVSLTFTTQKNGVKGESISQGCTGDPWTCPVQAVIRRILHIRDMDLPDDTPLCAYADERFRLKFVSSHDLTKLIRDIVRFMGPEALGLEPDDVSSRSLRAGGATAMLCAGIDPNVTQLVGRWKSDTMLRYLHVSTLAIANNYAKQMFDKGHHNFFPTLLTPVN